MKQALATIPFQSTWQFAIQAGLTIAGLVTISSNATAAEQIVLRYNVLERSVSIEELTTFAETGEISPTLENYFEMSGQKPARIRRVLTQNASMDVVPLDRMLNTPVGDVMLDQLGNLVHTPSGNADRQAMRSALVLSASDDSKLSLIEILQNYPTQEIHVNGNRIVAAYRQIENFEAHISNILEGMDFLGL